MAIIKGLRQIESGTKVWDKAKSLVPTVPHLCPKKQSVSRFSATANKPAPTDKLNGAGKIDMDTLKKILRVFLKRNADKKPLKPLKIIIGLN